jgi:5-methylcytosine-specific restriction protein B
MNKPIGGKDAQPGLLREALANMERNPGYGDPARSFLGHRGLRGIALDMHFLRGDQTMAALQQNYTAVYQHISHLRNEHGLQVFVDKGTNLVRFAQTEEEAKDPVQPPEDKQQKTTNLILYGPPGTGKTYRTALEAVRLCYGESVAEGLSSPDQRKELMEEYRQLVEDKRIAFVTFHQSLSYEEFVEGLRPETAGTRQDDQTPTEPAAGLRLSVHDGIFKEICGRAENDLDIPGDVEAAGSLAADRRIIRLGLTGSDWAAKFDRAIAENAIEWPHGGATDWSAKKYDKWENIKARRQQDDPTLLGNHVSIYGTHTFTRSPLGDYVMLTVGVGKIVAFGRLAGDYRFIPATDTTAARHIRPVEWIWQDKKGVDKTGIYIKDFTSLHTIYPLFENQLNRAALASLVLPRDKPLPVQSARPYVLIIDEINRANISKVFGELITLLEPDKRLKQDNEIRVTLPYSRESFGVPANLHIIGTMNTADRSIALLDTALRRRFTFEELMPDPKQLKENVDGINLRKLLQTINERIEYLFDREHQIGHGYFTGYKTRDEIEDVMRHKVIPLLAEYFYEDWSKVAAVLGDLKPGNPRFLKRDPLQVPYGIDPTLDMDVRVRWSVLPPRVGNEGGFNFEEFAAG